MIKKRLFILFSVVVAFWLGVKTGHSNAYDLATETMTPVLSRCVESLDSSIAILWRQGAYLRIYSGAYIE